MYQIYAMVDRVINWLGPLGVDSDKAMELIDEAGSQDFDPLWMEELLKHE
jgi:hypothetical protein